jgi:glycosyltransferase involved in cell wall biosynthesis
MIVETSSEKEIAPNYTLKLIKGLGYKKNVSIRRWMDHFVIEEKIVKFAESMPQPDIILVATPPHSLAYKVVKYAKRRNIPIIVDIRDQWPDIFIERLPKKIQMLGRFLLAYDYYKFKYTLFNADSVTAMMDELLRWGLTCSGRKITSYDKVFYIGTNIAEDVDLNDLRPELKKIFSEFSGKTVFSFIGTFSNFYNPSIIINVAKIFEQEGRNDVSFVLAGSGEHYNEVEARARNVKNIELTGWLQHEEIMALLKITDVGICPLNEHRPCFPNKVFIYLSAHLPVISSTPGEFEKLMKKHNIGIYYEPGDIEGLYNAVIKLLNARELAGLKSNVANVFSKLFDAEKIYKEFAIHLEKISNN